MNLPEQLLTAAVAGAFSLAGWLARHSYGLSVRFAVLESHFDEKKLDLDRVKSTQAADGIRLASTENAIQSLNRLYERMEQRFEDLAIKLDQIPRLTALLERFGPELQEAVPRHEHNQMMHQQNDRFKSIEDRLRDIDKEDRNKK
jgi:TolA-binding protein